jgi:integrase
LKKQLTEEQYEALKANCRYTWLRAFLAAAYTFGFRKSELLNLQPEAVGDCNRDFERSKQRA